MLQAAGPSTRWSARPPPPASLCHIVVVDECRDRGGLASCKHITIDLDLAKHPLYSDEEMRSRAATEWIACRRRVLMGFYSNVILPRLCHLAMRNKRLLPYRERVIGAAEGRVLEIGAGSGLNLPFYRPPVGEILALEPAPRLIAIARHASHGTDIPVRFLEASAESIPLEDNSVDNVATTWTLCTIPQVEVALHEIRRVLRPGGRLLFVEHGLAPDEGVRRWQDRLTPIWKCVSGGCHLNRPIRTMIETAGFRCDRLETGYMLGFKPMTFLYEGSARPR